MLQPLLASTLDVVVCSLSLSTFGNLTSKVLQQLNELARAHANNTAMNTATNDETESIPGSVLSSHLCYWLVHVHVHIHLHVHVCVL